MSNILVVMELNRSHKPVDTMLKNFQKSDNIRIKKKKLERIKWDIAVHVLMELYNSGKTKKTTLALNAKMNYNNCLLYLDWFEMFGFVNRETDEQGFEMVGLSDVGIDFFRTRVLPDQELKIEHFTA